MIAAPGFYAERMPGVVDHRALLDARLPQPLAAVARRSATARGLALGWLARRGDGVAVIRRDRGTLPALWVCAVPPARRRIFVLELIRRPPPRTPWRRPLYRAWWKLVETPALQRGMAAGQVMTEWERVEYARHYGIEAPRIEHVPWAWMEGGNAPVVPVNADSRRVFSSGRTACDWETVFTAASGAGWELSVACSEDDAGRVRSLAAAQGARVEVELPWAEHLSRLRDAAVYVIALADRGLSAGHVRLMAAVEAGVPVVATRVPSLEGYVVDGETAKLVDPGDADGLRRTVDALLDDPERRRALRDAARQRGEQWTYREYFARLSAAVSEAAGGSLRLERQ